MNEIEIERICSETEESEDDSEGSNFEEEPNEVVDDIDSDGILEAVIAEKGKKVVMLPTVIYRLQSVMPISENHLDINFGLLEKRQTVLKVEEKDAEKPIIIP